MRGNANKCRNARGREYAAHRVEELERLNRAAPLIVYNIYSFHGRFEVYHPRKRSPYKEKGDEMR